MDLQVRCFQHMAARLHACDLSQTPHELQVQVGTVNAVPKAPLDYQVPWFMLTLTLMLILKTSSAVMQPHRLTACGSTRASPRHSYRILFTEFLAHWLIVNFIHRERERVCSQTGMFDAGNEISPHVICIAILLTALPRSAHSPSQSLVPMPLA